MIECIDPKKILQQEGVSKIPGKFINVIKTLDLKTTPVEMLHPVRLDQFKYSG